MRPAELMSKYLSCNIWTGLHFFKVYSVRTVKLCLSFKFEASNDDDIDGIEKKGLLPSASNNIF